MKQLTLFALLIIFVPLPVLPVSAQEASPSVETSEPATDEVAHEQLRQLRRNLDQIVQSGNWESLTPLLTERVIVTWIDGTQSHTPSEVVSYLESKTGGPSPIVEKFSLKTEVKELSDFYGDNTALAFGTVTSSFVLRSREVSMSGPWSATMVHEGERWKLASLTASVGAFDNPLLTWAWRLVWIAAGVCGVIGLLIGCFLGRRRSRHEPAVGAN